MPPANPEDKLKVAIAIMAKAPIPGRTKTRLIPHLGAEGAAALQRWLLQRTVATALAADIGPVTLWCAPDSSHPEFTKCAANGPITLCQQPEGDLGVRMHLAIAESPSPAGTLVVGTDCPMLDAAHLQRAAAALVENEAVLTPPSVFFNKRASASSAWVGSGLNLSRFGTLTAGKTSSACFSFAPNWQTNN